MKGYEPAEGLQGQTLQPIIINNQRILRKAEGLKGFFEIYFNW